MSLVARGVRGARRAAATVSELREEAERLTRGDRRDDYGHPTDNHSRTATLWSAYLHCRGYPRALSAEDVCWLNVLQKLSRECHRPTHDNLVDAVGYILNIQEMRDS